VVGRSTPLKSIGNVLLVAKILFLDAIVGLFLAALVVDDRRRAPILYLAVPFVLALNLLIVWFKSRNPGSITLPVVYGVGSLWGTVWTAVDFAWWKIPLLACPSFLLYMSIQRFRRNNELKSEH
jgi:hypothetical protein